MAKDIAIEAKGLTKSFKKLHVLKGVDITVERGTILALLGPNGAGKTTIVKILSTLLEADGGSATINGFDVTDQADDVRGSIGLTGQYAAVDELLTGRQNLHMMGALYRLEKSDIAPRAAELLEQFDLAQAADRRAKTYSGGMRRRLDLAISLIAAPPILFLDEPTTGLDPRSRQTMWQVIRDLVTNGATILLTTQYLEEADQLADRIAVIDDGKVIAEGTADELKSKVGGERLELVVAPKSNFEAAVRLFGNDILYVDAKRRHINLSTTEGIKELKAVLDKLEKAGIEIETLSLARPTLDDVFLKITGHKATADVDEDEGDTGTKKGGK